MFNLQLTSINRCFLEIQGISSFFRPSPLPRLLPNNAPQHTWSRCVLSVGMRTSAYQGDGITSCKPLTTKGQSRTGRKRKRKKKKSGTRDSSSKYRDKAPSFTDAHLCSISPTNTQECHNYPIISSRNPRLGFRILWCLAAALSGSAYKNTNNIEQK